MSTWNDLVNAAMIGTAKKTVPADAFFPEVNTLLQHDNSTDNETLFLRGLALSSIYRRSGVVPDDYGTAAYYSCPPDQTPECSDRASVLLQTLLNDRASTLVHFWLDQCTAKKLRVPYRVLPGLLDLVIAHPEMQRAMLAAGGTTAGWLAGFYSAWEFARSGADYDTWHHGKPAERLTFITALRENINPDEARELVKATWDQENENTKKSFLKVFQYNLSEKDLPWLESLLKTEKVAVRRMVYDYLRRFATSSIVQQYIEIARTVFVITKGSSLLNRNAVISIYPPKITDNEIFESGIPKQSKDADASNEQAMFEELIKNIPPSLWAREAGLQHEGLLATLASHRKHKRLIDCMLQAAVQFGDTEWLTAFGRHRGDQYVNQLALLLPDAERMSYCMKHFDKNENEVLEVLKHTRHEFTTEQARRILRFTSKNPYQYKRDFYADMIWQFPEEIRFELGAFGPDNNNAGYYWNTLREELEKLLATKEQIVKSFNT
jgi:hypothetical protein